MTERHKPAQTPAHDSGSLRTRVAVLMAVLAVPAVAMPGDFGEMAGSAPFESESVSRELAAIPAMPFERPGMTFPGSAFFYLADPMDEALVALPTTDPFSEGAEGGREIGQLIDAGPAARPFHAKGGLSSARAQQCLAQAIWYEAASEGEAGQRAVAQVVLNRVAHPSWPNSVCGVVYQGSERSTGCQFTFTCDGSLARRAGGASWVRANRLASEALAGSVYKPIGHATHYHTLWVNPVWAGSLDSLGTIGAHRFYRNRGAGGDASAFRSTYGGYEPSVTGRLTPRLAEPVIAGPVPAARSEPRIDPVAVVAAPPSPVAPSEVAATKKRFGGAGQIKSQYARAGQWKDGNPASSDD